MQTNWVAGKSGNWTNAANWTNGVPGSGDSATIADGRPLMVDQAITDERINITPVDSQRVTLTLNGNDSFDAKTVLNIDTANASSQGAATLFFGNMRDGGRAGGSFNNHGTINVTGAGYPGAEIVHFDLSGGYSS